MDFAHDAYSHTYILATRMWSHRVIVMHRGQWAWVLYMALIEQQHVLIAKKKKSKYRE